jgi:hypothetical protein
MAVAAAFFTYVISLVKACQSSRATFKEYAGGEIVVYADKTSAEAPKEKDRWLYHQGETDPFTICRFYFQILHRGISHIEQTTMGFSPGQLNTFTNTKGVDGVGAFHRLLLKSFRKSTRKPVKRPFLNTFNQK